MTVQELIDELMKVEDKTKKVVRLHWDSSDSGTSWESEWDLEGVANWSNDYVQLEF